MAHLQATYLDEYRLPFEQTTASDFEHSLGSHGAYMAYKEDTPNLINAALLEQNKIASTRTTTYPVVKIGSFSVTTTRSCTAIVGSSESANVAVTYSTMQLGFDMIPGEYGNNHIKYFQDFTIKMNGMQRVMKDLFDGYAYTQLNTKKSVVNRATDNPYPVVGDTMIVPLAEQERFFNNIYGIMDYNDFGGSDIQVVGSPHIQTMIAHLGAQGGGNATNYAYQFGGIDYKYSRRVAVAAGHMATAFVYPKGSLGLLTWINPDATMGNESTDGKVWSVEHLPLLGMDVGMLYSSGCADNSSRAGSGREASLKENFIFDVDYGWTHAYNSDTATYPGSIYKAGLSKT